MFDDIGFSVIGGFLGLLKIESLVSLFCKFFFKYNEFDLEFFIGLSLFDWINWLSFWFEIFKKFVVLFENKILLEMNFLSFLLLLNFIIKYIFLEMDINLY